MPCPFCWQLLSRDLNRVKEDTFTLEQRLDRALEEERLNQQACEEERLNQQALEEDRQSQQPFQEERLLDQQAAEEEERRNQQALEEEGLNEALLVGLGTHGLSEELAAASIMPRDQIPTMGPGAGGGGEDSGGSSVPLEPPEHVAPEMLPHPECPDAGVSGAPDEYGRGGDADEGSVGVMSDDQEVDFVGDDEEDNVWQ